MLKEKEIYRVNIESVNNLGNGVAHIDGMALFVPYAITGDVCDVLIKKQYPSYAIGSLSAIIEKSPFRTEPACNHFKECGGCSYLNLDLDRENTEKENQAASALRKFKIEAKTVRTQCPVAEKYRNKVVLFYGNGGFGYNRHSSYDVVLHSKCQMNPPVFDKIAEYCKNNLNKSNLRALFIRMSSLEKPEIMVAPIYKSKTDIVKFSMGLVSAFPEIRTILLGINKEKDFAFEKTDFSTVYGDGHIEDTMCGLTFSISPRSFYQINHSCATALYEKAIELLDAKPNDKIADLFCGTGTMGMIVAARTGARVTGVEIEQSAIRDAKINARLNGIKNIEFFADDAKNFDKEVDSCIIDPPRKGCSKLMIDTLLRLKPSKIVYVSCNPDTMARDINLLSSEYEISSPVSVYNMFPRTSHVESVVCLARKTN
ncbi:MAG: 23S rRNA (uracil(1939)-C(5))-methyltransferase RlmD [Clostridia bacterium]|nr:23S rRNA (uracil(1939)-C(5))-methyltransferase RlmD [Clostridia bacterium]